MILSSEMTRDEMRQVLGMAGIGANEIESIFARIDEEPAIYSLGHVFSKQWLLAAESDRIIEARAELDVRQGKVFDGEYIPLNSGHDVIACRGHLTLAEFTVCCADSCCHDRDDIAGGTVRHTMATWLLCESDGDEPVLGELVSGKNSDSDFPVTIMNRK